MQIKRIALGGIIMTVIMFTPTYACVGTSDGIASYRSMENYISQIEQNGTNAKIEVFKGLSHGFGLGERTVAEGWIDHAISFWEDNMNAWQSLDKWFQGFPVLWHNPDSDRNGIP